MELILIAALIFVALFSGIMVLTCIKCRQVERAFNDLADAIREEKHERKEADRLSSLHYGDMYRRMESKFNYITDKLRKK